MSWLSRRTGRILRRVADRIDRPGAPKYLSMSFTFEDGIGTKVREDGKGCPLWALNSEDYERAHTESDSTHVRVDWVMGRSYLTGGGQ